MGNESQSFTITFKTIAELTGVDQLANGIKGVVREVETINTRLQGIASRVNAALGAVGLGLSLSKLEQLGDKALEAAKQQAVFSDQVLGSKEGSQQLVQELTALNEELERTTGTSKGTSRSIEQLLLRAGATGDQVKSATHAIIEFAASSAGTVGPLELAQTMARKLGSASDLTDISLGRLGIRAKDFNGAVKEMATRGGDAAEAMKRASGGMADYEIAVHHAELAVGRFVNSIRIPFFTALMGTFGSSAKEAKKGLEHFSPLIAGIDDAVVSARADTTDWLEKFAIAAAVLGHTIGNVANVAKAVFYAVATVEAAIIQLGLAAGIAVSAATEKLVVKAVDALAGLAKFAASTASTLSGGLIPDQSATIEKFAENLKSKYSASADVVREKWLSSLDLVTSRGEEALAKLQKSVDAMSEGGGGILSGKLVENTKKLLRELRDSISNVAAGSRVAPPGDDGAAKAKAATDALTQSKFALASAEQSYKTALETTKLLEESGQITHDQANQRNIAAARDYMAELDRLKATLPGVIAQLEALGNTKGAAELKLQFQELIRKHAELEIQLSNTTFFGKIRSQLQQLANEWGDLGKQVGGFLVNSLNTAVNGVSQAITGLITKTTTWRQASTQAISSIVGELVQLGVKYVAHYALTGALMLAHFVQAKIARAFDTADHIRNETAKAASSGANAVLTSISSWGAAAAVGLAAVVAAVAAARGFQGGGYTGDGPADRPAGIVHAGEVVFPAPRVRELGRDWLVNMAIGNMTRPGYQRGGAVGGGGTFAPGAPGAAGANQPIHIINVYSMEDAFAYAIKSPRGRKIINDHINNNRIDLGI